MTPCTPGNTTRLGQALHQDSHQRQSCWVGQFWDIVKNWFNTVKQSLTGGFCMWAVLEGNTGEADAREFRRQDKRGWRGWCLAFLVCTCFYAFVVAQLRTDPLALFPWYVLFFSYICSCLTAFLLIVLTVCLELCLMIHKSRIIASPFNCFWHRFLMGRRLFWKFFLLLSASLLHLSLECLGPIGLNPPMNIQILPVTVLVVDVNIGSFDCVFD